MAELPDVVVSYGVSDEYRYVVVLWCGHRASTCTRDGKWAYVWVYIASCFRDPVRCSRGGKGSYVLTLFGPDSPRSQSSREGYLTDCRTPSKITTTVVSTFTASYTHQWPLFFPDQPLTPPLPTFDGRAVLYPTLRNLRDYLSWRQVDCTFLP